MLVGVSNRAADGPRGRTEKDERTPIRLARILAAQRTLAERAEVQLQDHTGSEISVGDGATFDWKEPNVDEEKGGYAA